MTTKIYKELDKPSRQIRLLHLQPGTFDDKICGFILIESLDEEPVYEALSYVWGDAAVKSSIWLGKEFFEVTKNLEQALRHLRHEKEVRQLWIDALCINQENLAERNHQVTMMRDIYQQSAKVLVWFGPADYRNQRTVKIVDAVNKKPELHWMTLRPTSKSALAVSKAKSTIAGLIGAQSFMPDKVNLWDVFTFLKSQWWERMWVVQEYVLAKDVDFITGHEIIPGAKLVALGKAFFQHQAECCPDMDEKSRVGLSSTVARQMLTILEMERLREEKDTLSFLELSSLYRLRSTTDLHDKIYGLLPLAKEGGQIVVDYSLSTDQAYEAAAVGIIKATSALDILTQIVDHRPPPGWSAKEADEVIPPPPITVPSWVPNWSADLYPEVAEAVRVRMAKIRHFSASGTRKPVIVQHSSGRITLLGVLIDVIEKAGRSQGSRGSNTWFVNEWRELSGIEREPEKPYVDHKSTSFEAFWRSLILDVELMRDRRANDDTRDVHDAWWWSSIVEMYNNSRSQGEAKEKSRYAQKGGLGHSLNYFNTDVCRSVSQRRFFISKKGYMGVVPAKAEPGDILCILFGGKVPFVIRSRPLSGRVDQTQQEYTFLGDAYVHGLMDGEVISMLEDGQLKEQGVLLV